MYVLEKTIAANTSEASAKHYKMRLPAEVIYRVLVQFHKGNGWKGRLRVRHEGSSLFPQTEKEAVTSDGEAIDFYTFFQLKEGQNLLDIYLWNTSTSTAHDVRITFFTLPFQILMPTSKEIGLIEKFFKYFRLR